MFIQRGWPRTIRSQLMVGFGAIFLVSFTSSAIGYRSLAQLRHSSRTLVEDSAHIRDLSLELQNNFLQARQAEEIFLNRWKTSITVADAQALIQQNEQYLSAARENLSELKALEGRQSDLAEELALLDSLFLNYESAFQATSRRINQGSQDALFAQRIQRLFQTIAQTSDEFENPNLQRDLWEIAAKEQAYFNIGDQQYLNDVRREVEQLARQLERSQLSIPQQDFQREIQAYLDDLNAALLLEQQVQVNAIVANNINREIDQIIRNIGETTQARAQAARLELDRTAQQSNAALLATALTALALTIWASLWLGRRIMRPITALQNAAAQISDGNLNYTLSLPGKDEFSLVADTFNQMVRQLRHTLDDLEARVAERTTALADSNQSLQEKTQSLEVALKQLRESEHNYRSLLEHLQAGVVVHDHTTQIVLCNQMAAQLLGMSAEQLLGRHASGPSWPLVDESGQLLTAEQYPVNQVIAHRVPLHNYVLGIQRETSKQPVWTLVNAFPTFDDQHALQQVVVTFNDITERKLAEEKLRHRALHDVLTNLPNRTLLIERLDHAIQQARRHPQSRFAVLFIDLNRFKVINDSLGHTIGDQLLIQVAQILTDQVRTVDTVARLGGDEFVILLEQVHSLQEVIRVVERIQTEIQIPITLMGYTMFTSASIGIALSNDSYQRGQEILRDADNAMYRAKAKGESNYEIFNPEMHVTALQLLSLETDLRQAIAQQAFYLQYQPIVDVSSPQLMGFEALVRWQHATRGRVPPDQFIPLAEETGLIIPLSELILQQACEQMSHWCQHHAIARSLRVSVNIAAGLFQNALFVEKLETVLTQTQLPATNLKLEVTESVLLENVEVVLATLSALKQRQIEVSLDDFGTGYSSLSYLKQFPIDTLKIDKSFVDSLEQDGDASLVEAIIQIANSLEMTVVAEGVETIAQQAWLQRLGCSAIQGYLISRPLDAPEAEQFMQTFHP